MMENAQQAEPKQIAVIPGDGIGKEVTPQAVKAVQASGAEVVFTTFDWSADRYLRDGTTVPAGGLSMLKQEYDSVLLGAMGDPRVPSNAHAKDILLGMRFEMDLYANVRPVKLLDESLCPLKAARREDVDFVVIRENTEGPYVQMGGVFKKGTADEVAIQEDVNTFKGVDRILRYAFEYARKTGRTEVVMTDKSNVMAYAHGIWKRLFQSVGEEYPEIQKRHMFVDALCMEMVRCPAQFEVIVANNMFGDIITDLGAALQGGLGMAASANIHPGRTSMFEPVHGSAPLLAGKNVANPIGSILSAAMFLEDLGLDKAACKIQQAVYDSVQTRHLTTDVGGTLGTEQAGDWIAERIAAF